MYFKIISFLFILIPILSWSDSDHERAKYLYETGEILSLQQIIQKSAAYFKGNILEVELEKKSYGLIYEIELLNEQGAVVELKFDAKTGRLLSREYED